MGEERRLDKDVPVRELVRRGEIGSPSTAERTVEELLSFFGVGSVAAWNTKFEAELVSWQQSLCPESLQGGSS